MAPKRCRTPSRLSSKSTAGTHGCFLLAGNPAQPPANTSTPGILSVFWQERCADPCSRGTERARLSLQPKNLPVRSTAKRRADWYFTLYSSGLTSPSIPAVNHKRSSLLVFPAASAAGAAKPGESSIRRQKQRCGAERTPAALRSRAAGKAAQGCCRSLGTAGSGTRGDLPRDGFGQSNCQAAGNIPARGRLGGTFITGIR